MGIRSQLIMTVLLFGVVLGVVSASAIITNQQIIRSGEQEEIADSIARGAGELGYLANGYVIHRESQLLDRWHSRFTSFSSDVARLQYRNPEQQVTVRNMQANSAQLRVVFGSVASTVGSLPQNQGTIDLALLQVSWSRLEVQVQELVSDANRLSGMLHAQAEQLKQTNMLVTFIMIGVFVAYSLVNYFMTQRRVLKGIATLQAGTAVIGSGNLDFKIEEKKNDEIGYLARAFNQMTANLKDVTTTKAELEREIEERKKVEEALREHREHLEELVAERTAELSKSEERYRTTLDGMLEGCQVIGFDWCYRYLNDAAAGQGRRPKEELLGRTMMQAYPGIENTEMFAHLRRCMENRTSHRMENEFTYPDGEKGWFELRVEPVPEGVFILSLDVTERKRAEQRLLHMYGVMLTVRNVNQLIVRTDDESQLLREACAALVDGRNYRVAWIGLTSKDSFDVLPVAQVGFEDGYLSAVKVTWDDSEYGRGPTGTAMRTCSPSVVRDILHDERYLPWREETLRRGCRSSAALPLMVENNVIGALSVCSATPDAFDNAEIDVLVELAGDISLGIEKIRRRAELRQAAEELRRSEGKYSTLVERSNDGIIIVQDGTLKFVNSRLGEMTGFSPEEALGEPFLNFIAPEYRAPVAESYRKRMCGEEAQGKYEIAILSKDGREVFVETNASRIEYEGRPAEMAIVRDITDRKRAEEEISKLLSAVEQGPAIVTVTDAQGVIQYVNPRFSQITGFERHEIVGTNAGARGTSSPEESRPMWDALHGGQEWHGELQNYKKTGELYWEAASIAPVKNREGVITHFVKVAEDISERKRMQEQLIITDRLASIGELASGIAHELNNPLTGVLGLSSLLLERVTDEDVKQDLKLVCSEAQRAAKVVKNLLTFARKHPAVRQLVSLNSVIQRVLELRAYEQTVSNIRVISRLAPDLPEIVADDFQLQQVFLNIIINAEYFMVQAHNRGELMITTEKGAGIVRASFSDDGTGIPKENLGHVFDPFFTSKEVGKGTGLGLSICHGIVAAHGGRIFAESELGKGATFVIELPLGDREGIE
ncbi:MAG: Histidine kinase [Dehalococcoidia bacterium]|nr:Histidine kinase [Dehalococcoidia bacterium]